MLNRTTAAFCRHRAIGILNGPKRGNSRTMRRFLAEIGLTDRTLVQSFAFNEGYSAEQLGALRQFALAQIPCVQTRAELAASCEAVTIVDPQAGSVCTVYTMPTPVASASVCQLQNALRLVAVLAAPLIEMQQQGAGRAAGFADYRYRGLPCSILPDHLLWAVSGQDKRDGGGGVLEWCVDEADAQALFSEMQRFPARFSGLTMAPFAGAQPQPQAA